MTGPRIMQSQELATARPVLLPPAGETCDELVYLTTDTPDVPDISTPAEHEALGPAALVAVTSDGQWVWARAFRLPWEVQQRREAEARIRAAEEREAAVLRALDGLHLQVGGGTWPGDLRRVPSWSRRSSARSCRPDAPSGRSRVRGPHRHGLPRWFPASPAAYR